MCGIHLTLSTDCHLLPNDRTRQLLIRRGPDASRRLDRTCTIKNSSQEIFISCFSTVLALRGDHTAVQPVVTKDNHDDSSFLCWNGEAWKIDSHPVSGNDSEAVFSLFSRAVRNATSQHAFEPAVMTRALAAITGPYAFAYYHDTANRLYFGRDPLGRRSLMFRFDQSGNFFLATISDATEPGWQELDANGVYSIDLTAYATSESNARTPLLIESFPYSRPLSKPTLQNLPAVSHEPLQTTSPSVTALEDLLRHALRSRICTIPDRLHIHPTPALNRPATMAILFSGGLDCTVLARLSHDFLDPAEPIDLLNVAFENPRVHKRPSDPADAAHYSPYELCPDRITGRASFAELQRVCPTRDWRFVAIDIPYSDFLAHRGEVISLIHPHNTEMDLSIACALYFAARGSGFMTSSLAQKVPQEYTTAARILFSGLGADELFGGYQRHATAFARKGSGGLLEELDLDIGRLGKRNLGRDDRVLSNWARETRFPFLDEDVVEWAINTPVCERCDFGAQSKPNPPDEAASLEPGKKVLRCLAWKLGMHQVAGEKKRAVSLDFVSLPTRHKLTRNRSSSVHEPRKWRLARSKAPRPWPEIRLE